MDEEVNELELYTTVIYFYFKRGWLTENEKLRFSTKKTLDKKKIALFDVMKNMNCEANSARLLCAIRCLNQVDISNYNWEIDGSEKQFLSIIMANLFDKSLISLEEKLDFEKLVEAENGHQNGVSEGARLVEDQEKNMELGACENTSRNPMEVDPIIRCILQYLNVEQIKKCRYVSKEWASVALKVLTTRSVIYFSRGDDDDTESKTPLKFFQVFPDTPPNIVPFSAFSISHWGDKEDPWTIEELNYFFERQGKYIFELGLHGLYLVNDRNKERKTVKEVEMFDISPWLSNSPIIQADTKKWTKLEVLGRFGSTSTSTDIVIPLSVLSFAKHLDLVDCSVNIQDGIQIRPISITLVSVTMVREENELPEFCINDIFDFSKTEHMDFYNSDIWLDLGRNETVTFKFLYLESVTVRNWESCRWNVDKLNLKCIPLTEEIKMKIKELNTDSKTDLSILPQSLKRLRITATSNNNCFCSQPIALHNLKCLRFNLIDDSFSTVSQNFRCPNLVNLTLKTKKQTPLDLEWISETIKNISLKGVTVKNEQNKELNLDKLILNYYTPADAKHILSTGIETKELVLCLPIGGTGIETNFFELLEYDKNRPRACHRIYAGRFYWNAYSSPSLRSCVDTEAEYYVFENQQGKSIDSLKTVINISYYSDCEDE